MLLNLIQGAFSLEKIRIQSFQHHTFKMTITFDPLDQFQKNKVWQTAQPINNILRPYKKW